MQSIAVRVGINCHRPDLHLAARANDAAGYLSAIGDENFFEHRILIVVRGSLVVGCGWGYSLQVANHKPQEQPTHEQPTTNHELNKHRISLILRIVAHTDLSAR